MVNRNRAELDRERDRTGLRELVAVESERQACCGAGLEVAACLGGIEGPALEEDVGRFGDRRGLGQHLGEREVEVGVGVESNSGGTACAPSQVGMPPAAAIARS